MTRAPGFAALGRPAARAGRGMALVAALAFAVVLAVIAQSLARMALDRVVLYRRIRDLRYQRVIAKMATDELAACLYGKMPPLRPTDNSCQARGWSSWIPINCPFQPCTTVKTFKLKGGAVAATDVRVAASWNADGIHVTPDPPVAAR